MSGPEILVLSVARTIFCYSKYWMKFYCHHQYHKAGKAQMIVAVSEGRRVHIITLQSAQCQSRKLLEQIIRT